MSIQKELKKLYRNFIYTFFRISVDENSEIYPLLKENWENYKTYLCPQDKKMSVLGEKDVQGMSTENTRFFTNETVRRFAKDGVYLEVGTFHGCSLLSALCLMTQPGV